MNTNQNSKTNLIEKITALFLALSLTACSVTPVSTQSPSAPPATEAIPTPTEIAIELEGEVFLTTENFPEEVIPSMELFIEMAQGDGLDINELHPILWIKAAQGELSVNYALLQIATVSDLTDPDNQPANPKPVYYIAYQDQQGQMQGGYVLGKIIEKDSQGASYVARMLSEETFRNWQNNTQPEDGSYTVGQVVYSIPLREDISVEQARTMQAKLNSGELYSKDFMENYAEGVAFIQPGQEKQVVGIDKNKSTPELIAKPFWQELFSGVTEAQAAGLEFSSEPEPTPTAEPTQTPEQALAEFKESAEYKQGLQDYLNAMGLEAENVEISEEVKIINGQEYRFLVAIPDQTKLSIEQQRNIEIDSKFPLAIGCIIESGKLGWRMVGLKDLTTGIFGTSTIWNLLDNNKLEFNEVRPKYIDILKKDFSKYTMQFNWSDIQPNGPGNFNFSVLDWQISQLAKFGITERDMILGAHTLIWQSEHSIPQWLKNGNYSNEEISQFMVTFIKTVVGRYKGRIDTWIVVNEPAGNLRSWVRDDFYYKQLGPEYIDMAFQVAREADLTAKLIFNDTDNHEPLGETTNNSKQIVNRLKSKGYIDGIGIQMHLDASKSFDSNKVREVLDDYGVPIYITELDIDMTNIVGTSEERLRQQALIMAEVIKMCLESESCVSITMWEAPGDRFNWLENYMDKSNADPTLWDDNLNPKMGYYFLIKILYEELLK
jgi:endo-1,4-beta-xylanase